MLSLFAIIAAADDYVVEVPGLGTLQGFQRARGYDGVAEFLSIPFAKPPVGALRFQPPVPHGPWTSPLDATKAPPQCMQLPTGGSEDCLYLNVTTPASALKKGKKLPVMYWIYGGGYFGGTVTGYPYAALVHSSAHSVVLAAGNYRLGAIGFLASKEIQARTSDGSAGNFGIQDQQLAMVWVRDHIGAFGGDGADVTIFGESAGGNSVMNHLAHPGSGGLFAKAIMESGTYSTGVPMWLAEETYTYVKNATHCDDLDCLLAASAWNLTMAGGMDFQGPVIDGVNLPVGPFEVFDKGQHHKVPVIIGSNRDEVGAFMMAYPANMTEQYFDNFCKTLYYYDDDMLDQVKRVYDPAVYPFPEKMGFYNHWWWTAVRMATDMTPGLGACSTRALARTLLKGGTPAAYTYLFGKDEGLHVVGHGFEIPYVFGDVNEIPAAQKNRRDLAETMSAYWSTFAVAGDPNRDGLPEWLKYDANADPTLRFDDGPAADGVYTVHALRKDACDFWDLHPLPTSDIWAKIQRGDLPQSLEVDVLV